MADHGTSGSKQDQSKRDRAKLAKFLARLVVAPETTFTFRGRKPDQTFGWDRDEAEAELATLLLQIDVLYPDGHVDWLDHDAVTAAIEKSTGWRKKMDLAPR